MRQFLIKYQRSNYMTGDEVKSKIIAAEDAAGAKAKYDELAAKPSQYTRKLIAIYELVKCEIQ